MCNRVIIHEFDRDDRDLIEIISNIDFVQISLILYHIIDIVQQLWNVIININSVVQ